MKPKSRRILNVEAREAIDKQSDAIAAEAHAIGTSGQALLIADLAPLEAAYAAIRCFRSRLADGDGLGAISFAETLREHASAERVSAAVIS